MRLHALLAPVALLALAACGGPLLSAEVEVERFCFVQANVADVPFVPAGTPSTTFTSPSFSYPLSLPPLLRARGSEVEVRLDSARLFPVPAGSVDLSGIQTLRVEQVVSAGPPEVVVVLARYQRAGTGPVAEITASGQGVDLAAAARAGSFSARIHAEGTLPSGPLGTTWSPSLELCFYGRALMPYL